MAWTYTSQVDLTNGGADDQTAVTIASGLPSGIVSIDVLWHSVSTDANDTALIIRLGDAGGIEAADYNTSIQNGITYAGYTTAWYTSRNTPADAADIFWGCMSLWRWDVSEHYWFGHVRAIEPGTDQQRWGAGFKTLSGELTQLQATTAAGTASFDGGEIRLRYE
jgi:hypothetical protein